MPLKITPRKSAISRIVKNQCHIPLCLFTNSYLILILFSDEGSSIQSQRQHKRNCLNVKIGYSSPEALLQKNKIIALVQDT